MVGCYLEPHDSSTLERIVAEIDQQPQGVEFLVTMNFNTDLSSPDGHEHNKTTETAIAMEDLEDIAAHLPPRISTLGMGRPDVDHAP